MSAQAKPHHHNQNETGADWFTELAHLLQLPADLVVQGLPTSKNERWKYTPLLPALKRIPAQHTSLNIATSGFINTDAVAVPRPAGNLFEDAVLPAINQCNTKTYSLVSHAQVSDGSRDLTLTFTSDADGVSMTRTAIQIDAGVHATLVEQVGAASCHWLNQLQHISIGEGASLTHLVVHNNSDDAVITRQAQVLVAGEGRYTAIHIQKNGGLIRQETNIDLLGAQALGQVYGLNLGAGKQVIDNTILIRHLAPDCRSDQFVRTILTDRAQGVFQGKIFVDRIAQRTDGYQLSNTILLSPLAAMNGKPELEIYADDVKCSHGSTTGPLDDDALFYLQSRGLDADDARRLVLQAYCAEVLERIADNDALHAIALENVETWLHQHRA